MPRRVVPPAQLSAQPVSISLQKLCPQVNRMVEASPSSWWSWHNEQNTWVSACSGSAAATVACGDLLRTFFGTTAAGRFFRQRRSETLLARSTNSLFAAISAWRTLMPRWEARPAAISAPWESLPHSSEVAAPELMPASTAAFCAAVR